MERKLNERLAMIADLEERGYSQDMIEDIIDYCENPNQDMHSFSTMEEALEWLNSDDDE